MEQKMSKIEAVIDYPNANLRDAPGHLFALQGTPVKFETIAILTKLTEGEYTMVSLDGGGSTGIYSNIEAATQSYKRLPIGTTINILVKE